MGLGSEYKPAAWKTTTRDGVDIYLCNQCYWGILFNCPTWGASIGGSSFDRRAQYPMKRHPGALLERSKPHGNNPLRLDMMCKDTLMKHKMWDGLIVKKVKEISEVDEENGMKHSKVHDKDIYPVFISVGDVARAGPFIIEGCPDLPANWEEMKKTKKPLKDIYGEIENKVPLDRYRHLVNVTNIEYPGWARLPDPFKQSIALGITGDEFNCIHLAIGTFKDVVGASRVPFNNGLVCLTKKMGGYTQQVCLPVSHMSEFIEKKTQILEKWSECDLNTQMIVSSNQELYRTQTRGANNPAELLEVDCSRSAASNLLERTRFCSFKLIMDMVNTPVTWSPRPWPSALAGGEDTEEKTRLSFRFCFSPVHDSLLINSFESRLVIEHVREGKRVGILAMTRLEFERLVPYYHMLVAAFFRSRRDQFISSPLVPDRTIERGFSVNQAFHDTCPGLIDKGTVHSS